MPQPVLLEGLAALDVLIAEYAGRLAETWPGDERLVGLLIQERAASTEKTAIAWAPRERVLADLAQRKEREQDPRRRQRFEDAIAAVSAPHAAGKVLLLVSGWGDLRSVDLEAADLRTGKLLTSWRGGSA
jgi:hypothetical protein